MLSPYRVLDLTDERGHFAGFILAMLGADVIAVEPPGGSAARRVGPFLDGIEGPDRSLTHLAYNRAKRAIALDLTAPAGSADRTQLERLVRGADVLIESNTPGELAALGLGYDDLAALNTALVYCSITPNGFDGPRAHEPATDLTIAAAGYSISLNGDADRAPVRVSVPQAYHFGAAPAAAAIVIALQERARSGLGQHLDASAQAGILLACQGGVMAEACNAPAPRRSAGGARVGPLELRFVYPAADGHVSVSHVFGNAIGPRTAALMAWVHELGYCSAELATKDWVRFAELVDLGEETVDTFEEAKAAIAAATSAHTKAELLAIAMERRLLIAPMSTPADVVASEHYAARGFFDEVAVPGLDRSARLPGVFVRADGQPRRTLGWAPTLDQHGDELRAEPERTPSAPAPTADPPVADPPAGADPPSGAHLQPRALEGLKVVDLTWSIAGPVTIRVLADHGATVVKVESITKPDAARGFMPVHDNIPGQERSALYDDMNAGKLSVALNLTKPEARATLEDLVRWADVLVESFSPRAMPAWGMGYERLREINPRLVMMSTCLFGQDGPLANFAGYGNLGAALTGFYGLTGWPDRAPAGPYLAYTDYTSNPLLLAALVAAVDRQRRTGQGCYLDAAQAEAAMHYLSPALVEFELNGTVADRCGNADRVMAPHGVYPAAGDDRWIAVCCQDDAVWPALAATIGRADLAADATLATGAGRLARQAELDGAVAAWTSARTPAEAERELQAVGLAARFVPTGPECMADPQLVHRRHFVELDHPERRCVVENARVRLSRTPARVDVRAPMSGEHTFEVLSDLLGYDVDRIADLAATEALE